MAGSSVRITDVAFETVGYDEQRPLVSEIVFQSRCHVEINGWQNLGRGYRIVDVVLRVSSDEDDTLVSAAAAFRDPDGETVRYFPACRSKLVSDDWKPQG
jgi:hypothetical protein